MFNPNQFQSLKDDPQFQLKDPDTIPTAPKSTATTNEKPKVWRFDLLNHLIKTQNYSSYLEIGVEGGDNFRLINSSNLTTKHGVDPNSKHATHQQTSDDFFAELPETTTYDLIFIDGLHLKDQVLKDITNSLNHLSDNGTILLHDCNPPTEWHQRSEEEAKTNGFRLWNGTVWQAYLQFRRSRSDLEMGVVDTDWGCGYIRQGFQLPLIIPDYPDPTIDPPYSQLDINRKHWLNLIDPQDFFDRFQ